MALNLLVGLRLDLLMRESQAADVFEIDRRVAAFPGRERVKVLVLGNSHAMHALRPQSLGPALGLAADEVFNLSLPGATSFETGLIAQRYSTRFTSARRAILGVDEALLMRPWLYDTRIRFLTRLDPVARWHYAAYMPDFERRISTFAAMPFPLADFAPAIREGLRNRPRLFATRLARGDTAWAPENAHSQVAAQDYRWGYPPRPDLAHDTVEGHQRFKTFSSYPWLTYRAGLFFDVPDAVGRSLADLEATCRALEARGIAVELVAPVYTNAMRLHLSRARASEQRAFRAALVGYQQSSGRSIVASTMVPADSAFIDSDHLSSLGARMYAKEIAPKLHWSRR